MASIYIANTSSQNVGLNGVINCGSIVRRSCLEYSDVNGMVRTRATNTLHDVSANITLEANAAGVATIAIYKDGLPITGATVGATVESGSTYTLNISDVIVRSCCCDSATISVVLGGVAATVTNATLSVRSNA